MMCVCASCILTSLRLRSPVPRVLWLCACVHVRACMRACVFVPADSLASSRLARTLVRASNTHSDYPSPCMRGW